MTAQTIAALQIAEQEHGGGDYHPCDCPCCNPYLSEDGEYDAAHVVIANVTLGGKQLQVATSYAIAEEVLPEGYAAELEQFLMELAS